MKHSAELSPHLLMANALEAYASWLGQQSISDVLEVAHDQAGTKLVAAVAEIGRAHFPLESLLVTELLVGHTKLSSIRFERRLKLSKSETTGAAPKSAYYLGLIRRQIATISVLGAACARPLTPVHVTPKALKGKRTEIAMTDDPVRKTNTCHAGWKSMKSALTLVALGLMLASSAAQATGNGQQSDRTRCNKEAADRRGDERQAFMKACLRPESPRQVRLAICNEKAKNRKGDERERFMSECLKG
jgi:hypothetical protein